MLPQLDEAISTGSETVEMDGSFYYGRVILGLALELNGQIPLWRSMRRRLPSDDPLAQAVLGRLCGRIGRRAEATNPAQLKGRDSSATSMPASRLYLSAWGIATRR